MVHRTYVEKKPQYAVESKGLLHELKTTLGINEITDVRIIQRYDVEGIDSGLFEKCKNGVFGEPPVDVIHTELPSGDFVLGVTYLPGQFDQRADSAAECIQLISKGERPSVESAKIFVFSGIFTQDQNLKIENHLINPVEACKASLAKKETLKSEYPIPPDVKTLDGFTQMDDNAKVEFVKSHGLAMDTADLTFCMDYFKSENRQPTETEIRLIDTYWSDHCRHTTFLTNLDNVQIEDEAVLNSYNNYKALRSKLYAKRSDKPECLMDIATIAAKELKIQGLLANLDESEEINACSIKIKVDNNGNEEDWLLMFKNETHNHPTEIEPFGGAATCIGGAIRDPLSGRAYVYQAMRVTGAGNPLEPTEKTLVGKLPQRKLVTTAAAGYSSYGNQIGLATGLVNEIYHPGYVAKRMEIGAVIGAVPCQNVRRETPEEGDIVILLGGRTGRDGCGGATGSSKAHALDSLENCGAEVQKGNAPVERKLQRLFRNPKASLLIRRCNDFGAGGISVAIGELADGLCIQLDAVPKKYEGLDGTELAISESQERMAVVVRPNDADAFISLANKENLEASKVALVTGQNRLVMQWRGKTIVDVSRKFLNSNGAAKHANVLIPTLPTPCFAPPKGNTIQEKLASLVSDLNFCSQKGLAERFDSTVGGSTVLMPFGGKFQLTPTQSMVAKIPTNAETATCSGMAYGFDPFVSEQNPYMGAYLAVVESLSKLSATGFSTKNAYLTFQEYFPRLHNDEKRWGQPIASLLGALQAQLDFGIAAIGGKDSMSGSFEDMDVPPTLVSFAVSVGSTANVISPEFKLPSSKVVLLRADSNDGGLLNVQSFKNVLCQLEDLVQTGKALAVYTCGRGGIAEALFKMCLGNGLGFNADDVISSEFLFAPAFYSFVVELESDVEIGELLGYTTGRYEFSASGETFPLESIQELWESKLEPVFPYRTPSSESTVELVHHKVKTRKTPNLGIAKPKFFIPVFPGTNCEYDTARAVQRAGGIADIFVIQNLTPEAVLESTMEVAKRIDDSQMLVFPGGFSGGDEPEGSAKLVSAFFRSPAVHDAVMRLLNQRDGLVLGICNGFQALIKLGLLPAGQIQNISEYSPTLTFNTIGRHQSMLVHTKITSNLSPWLMHEDVGTVHTVAISHGEGRFVANEALASKLISSGQVSTQYVNLDGQPSMDIRYNPNGSMLAIESLCSPDGRILGKMAHSERSGENLYKNVAGNTYQKIFEGGVDYYKI